MDYIGITERGDAALDLDWQEWVKEGRPAILISKDPLRLSRILKGMTTELFSPNVIAHATITGWGGTPYEPNVPKFPYSMEGYEELLSILGNELPNH